MIRIPFDYEDFGHLKEEDVVNAIKARLQLYPGHVIENMELDEFAARYWLVLKPLPDVEMDEGL